MKLTLWFLLILVSSISLAEDEPKLPTSPKSNIVGEEFHREYERRSEHGVILTEEEIQRRKKDATRAREILTQKIDELYAFNLTANHDMRSWHDTVARFGSRVDSYIFANLLQNAGNLDRLNALKERRSPIYEVIYHQRLWDLPGSQYPQFTEALRALADEYRRFALDLAMQKWENDKFLFH